MRIRILRVLEYEGEAGWVYTTLAKNAVKGIYEQSDGNLIREAIIGTVPEILKQKEE